MQLKLQMSSALLLAVASISNAWVFAGYPEADYKGEPVVLEGTLTGEVGFAECKEITTGELHRLVTSFKFDIGDIKDPHPQVACGVAAFDTAGCRGNLLYAVAASVNLPELKAEVAKIVDEQNHLIASVGVTCATKA